MAKAKQPVSINGIEFDALLDEERTLEADSPDYPVEDGFMVHDTIILKPMMLSMTLFVTDTPVTWKNRGHGGKGWTDSVIQRLESLYFSKQTVTVVTSSKTYTILREPIVQGVKLVPKFPINIQYIDERLPSGIFGVYTNLETVGRSDFAERKAIFAYVPGSNKKI